MRQPHSPARFLDIKNSPASVVRLKNVDAAPVAGGGETPERVRGVRLPGATRFTVLIVHSDPVVSAGLAALLRRGPKFTVIASRAWESLPHGRDCADVLIADYESGIRLTETAPGWRGRMVIFTTSDSEEKIHHALERGVRGYLLLGCAVKDLVDAIRAVHGGFVAVGPQVATRLADRLKRKTLTRREEMILGRLMLGLRNKDIARDLTLAVGTVKAHIKSIFAKLKVKSRAEAAAVAQRCGILSVDRACYQAHARAADWRGG